MLREIRAHKFVLVDDDGVSRGVIGTGSSTIVPDTDAQGNPDPGKQDMNRDTLAKCRD